MRLTTSFYGMTMALCGIYMALCGLVARLNQTWSDTGEVNQAVKGVFSCLFYVLLPKKTCGIFFHYWREILKRKRLGSVYGCLPHALEASAGFLEVVLTSASFINSQSHTQIELT